MKKILIILSILLMINSFVYARPAILDLNNLTLNFQCLRAVNCEGVSEDNCYGLVLQYVDPYFSIKSFSNKGVLPKENDDQTFNCETFELNIPYIEVGNDAYYVKLKYYTENGHIKIENAGKVANNNNNTGKVAGSCYVLNSDPKVQDICQTYYFQDDLTEEMLSFNCPFGIGRWVSGQKCETGDLGSCLGVPELTLHDTEYYDHGFVEELEKNGGDISMWINGKGGLKNTCEQNGGTWVPRR